MIQHPCRTLQLGTAGNGVNLSMLKAIMVNLHSGPTPRGREGSAATDAIDAAAMNHAPAAFILNEYRERSRKQPDNPEIECLMLA
jgi:hypothetical protein